MLPFLEMYSSKLLFTEVLSYQILVFFCLEIIARFLFFLKKHSSTFVSFPFISSPHDGQSGFFPPFLSWSLPNYYLLCRFSSVMMKERWNFQNWEQKSDGMLPLKPLSFSHTHPLPSSFAHTLGWMPYFSPFLNIVQNRAMYLVLSSIWWRLCAVETCSEHHDGICKFAQWAFY